MKTKLRLLTIAVAFAAPALNAASVVYNDTMSVTEGATNTLNLNKFNSALGTLTKVEVTVILSIPSFSIIVDNDSENSANVTVTFGTLGGVTYTSSASTLDGSLTTLSGSNFNVATQSSSFTVGAQNTDPTDAFNNDSGGDNGSFTTSSVSVGQTTTREINSAAWIQWTGASGTVDMELLIDFVTDMNINSGGSGGEVRFQGVIPSATYSAEVTYTYTAIPEPTAALLGGLGFLCLLRRRR
jgi:hypothetical protein